MTRGLYSKHDAALDSNDLHICQQALDAVLIKMNIESNIEESERAAALIIQLYRQGIHDKDKLLTLVCAAEGQI